MIATPSLTPPDPDVVVVGAGAAGLSAATTLVQAGATVAVVEARNRIGGRAHSRQLNDGTIDLGATWTWSNEPVIRSLIHQLCLSTFTQHLDGDALFDAAQTQRLDGNPIDVPATRFTDGAQSLLDALARRLPEDALRLDEPVHRIDVDSGGVTVHTRSREITAQHVVLAVPPALAVESITFAPDLPPTVRRVAERTAVWMGGVVKAVAVYDEPLWRVRGLSGSAISHVGPFREFHDHCGPDGSPAAIFGFAPAAGLPAQDDDAVATAFGQQLSRLFGDRFARPTSIHVMNWSAERYTQPRAVHGVGTSTFGHVAFVQPVHERIHWASTETAPAYAGHLEGAVRAGVRATQAIQSAAGQTLTPDPVRPLDA